MKFSYIALNEEHQKLTGNISADDEKGARDKLHTLKLSVISLQQTNDDVEVTDLPEEGIITFVFHVVDLKDNHIKGTIDAPDRKQAFKRLLTEYKFRILSLCDAAVPEENQEEEGKKDLKELAIEVEEEFGVNEADLIKSGTEIETHVSESTEESRKDIVANVEEIVARAEEILEKFNDELTGDEVFNVKSKIDTLMRIRLSNNLKYIQDLADELLIAIDATLQQHLDVVSTKRDGTTFVDGGKNLSAEVGHAAYMRDITSRMNQLLEGYNQAKRKAKRRKHRIQKLKVKKKITNPTVIRIILLYKAFVKMMAMLQRMVFAKNSVVRKQYSQQFGQHVQDFTKIFRMPDSALIPQDEDGIAADELKQKQEAAAKLNELEQNIFIRFLLETHLFFGWLLAFYIVYFYFSVFVLVKLGSDSPLFSFVYRSLSSPFPFLVTGFFFLMFLGLTFAIRVAKGKVILSTFVLICTFISIAALFFNF